jgi:hypothetical protein
MKTVARAVALIVAVFGFSSAHAVLIGGVDFPQGTASFADSVVDFTAGSGADAAFQDPTNALGPPDVNVTNGLACNSAPSTANCKFTSLGNGGSLTLRFTDNVLTGSGNANNDLYVFEVGVAEAGRVQISKDGVNFTTVGDFIPGSGGIGVFSYGFDIDQLGFGVADQFTYVRVLDLVNVDPETNPAGADIDAIGAIQTIVPLPGSAWLLTGALALLARIGRRGPFGG